MCRPAAGACDVPEVCNGTSPECPDDALAAAGTECRAATGVCDGAEVCDGASPACPADRETVTIRVAGSWDVTSGVCPACFTQFYVRLHGVYSLCLGNGGTFYSFDVTGSFTAPTAPGIYILNPAGTWDFDCVADTTAPTTFSSSSVATLVVE